MNFFNVNNNEYLELVTSRFLLPVLKIELLDEYERSYFDFVQDLNAINSGAINSQLQQGIRKTINLSINDPEGKFLPDPNDKFFWIGRKFKVYLGLQNKALNPLNDFLLTDTQPRELNSNDDWSKFAEDVNNKIFWFTKGVYLITNISGSNSISGKIISLQGVDKFGLFTNASGYNEMIGTFSLFSGTPVDKAIKEILTQDIGNGKLLDPVEPIIDPFYQNYLLPLDIDKGPGSYLGDLLIDLANMLHADVFYDNDGHLNFKRSLNTDEYKNINDSWDYHYGDSEYISNSVNFELLNVANSISVIGDNPNIAKLPKARAENNSPISPLAIQKIGRKTRNIESSTIKTQKEAQDYANYILKTSSLLGHTISFESTLIPHLEVDTSITISDPYFDYNQEKFIVTAITYPLGPGTMTISASNVAELPEV